MKTTRATRLMALGLAVLLTVVVVEVISMLPAEQALKVARGTQLGPGSISLYVTNAGTRAVFLAGFDVQVRSNGSWKTVSTRKSMILRGPRAYEWSGKLVPGAGRAVAVDAPTNGTWRVSFTYLKQTGEFRTRLHRLLVAPMPGETMYSSTPYHALSPETLQ